MSTWLPANRTGLHNPGQRLPASGKVPSHRQVLFQYSKVSDDLLHQMHDLMVEGEPLAILGPRGCGKQVQMARLAAMECKDHAEVIRIRCDELTNRFDYRRNQLSGWADSLELRLRTKNRRVTLLISDIDALPPAVSRQALRTLRRLKHLGQDAQGQLSVALTGSYDLAPLVYGVDSEFPITRQFVLCGYSEEAFQSFFEDSLRVSGLTASHEVSTRLFIETGGNILLLRLLLETLFDTRRQANCYSNRQIQLSEINAILQKIRRSTSLFSDVLVTAFSRAATSTASLKSLQELLTRKHSKIPVASKEVTLVNRTEVPTELELCGIAIRKNQQLCWSSPLMQSLAKQHFSSWTMGDCFASLGDWGNALASYQKASKSGASFARPVNQRSYLRAAIASLRTELGRLGGDPAQTKQTLQHFFHSAVLYTTGVDSVNFWTYQSDRWNRTSQGNELVEPLAPEALRIKQHLQPPQSVPKGIQLADGVDRRLAVFLYYTSHADGCSYCVTADTLQSGFALTAFQSRTINDLFNDYETAVCQLIQRDWSGQQAEINRRLSRTLPSLIQIISDSPDRSRQALQAAGDNLRSTDFRRVMFSLVDGQHHRIKGEIDCRGDGEPDIAERTDYSLKDELDEHGIAKYSDIQQKCVREKLTIRVSDARSEPLVNQAVCQLADLRAFVLVPIIYGEQVLGTIHFERNDGELPSQEYVSAMELLARQLGQVLHTMSWVDALESVALNEPDSVILLDTNMNVKFCNFAASRQMQVPPGFQGRETPLKRSHDDVNEVVHEVISGRRSITRVIKADGKNFVQEVSPIPDWRNVIQGFSVRSQDISVYSALLSAMRDFAKCTTIQDIADLLLANIRKLGHQWGRVFQSIDNDRMFGLAQFGFPDGSDGALAFQKRTALLSRSNQIEAYWHCLQQGAPAIFTTDSSKPWNEPFLIDAGLSIMNVKDPGDPNYLAKRDGDRWIDFPLIPAAQSGRLFGKCSIQCPETLNSESLRQLDMLVTAASTAWNVVLDRQDREIIFEAERRMEMMRAMGGVMHQLNSKIGSLWTWVDNAKQCPGLSLPEGLVTLTSRLNDVKETISSAKRKLRPLRCEPKSVEIRHELLQFFLKHLPEEHIEISAGRNDMDIDIDVSLFQEIVDELVQNSRKAAKDGSKVRISIKMEHFLRLGEHWTRIEITDNGPGIHEDELEEVFTEFYSAWPDDAGDNSSGGLGLSHVRSIMAVHHGCVRSIRCPAGACFRFELPSHFRPDMIARQSHRRTTEQAFDSNS